MPENMDNSPASRQQAEAYAIDKMSPEGKPYNREQQASNASSGDRTCMYHKEKGRKIFNKGEEIPEGWQDTPFFNHNNNNEPVGAEPEKPPEVDVKILRDECDARGIEYDKRWGKNKLMDALEGKK